MSSHAVAEKRSISTNAQTQDLASNEAQTQHLPIEGHEKSLVPTPTSDSLDPLNWSNVRKYNIIGIVCFFYFLLTYLTTAPVPSFSLLEEQFDATYNQVNWSFGISAFGLAFGPLVTSSVAETYGRRTVTIISTSIAVLASGCTAIRGQSIGQYMAARFFQGFAAGPAANVGLSIINDISWEHERGFRIGLWALSANIGSVLGGLIGGFIATVNQYWVAYHVTIAFAFLLVWEILFLPETQYPRAEVVAFEQQRAGAEARGQRLENSSLLIKRTTQLPWLNFRKIPGVLHPKPWATLITFCKLWVYPKLVASVCGYIFFHYWWIVALLSMIPAAYTEYKIQIQGLFFTGALVGVIFAEIFCSGHLSDWIVARLARQNQGIRTPEMRLWLGYPGAILSAIGLAVWGASVQQGWHWITGQIGLFLFAVGLQAGNTTLSTYIVDSYPEHAIEVITFYSVIINMSAFIVPWYIYDWTAAVGYGWCFGTQAIICALCLPPTYFVLHKWGPRWVKPIVLTSAELPSNAADEHVQGEKS
ncbi:hypothetical protein LTR10_017793 [Elasticomyces elasticus]|uniref:Major facilitator superfamily (MFS) profile domain-containing protein n=1 Tax=Exophiala sideris TaxID=1016849 RepID=A0ABR0JC92_9EURO|nr:hypothetical protein LTR10_017793 [Elasticomyces elasticus]KAK5031303.1 hypothetical protein LTS07_005038 [Exophiala sideris]KAK5039023.1 hypothetical protein LTR13_004054 [Exophiala sideris]KAK5060908.1 hypothetical protein LTR69_005507 [Exophiala sideris]KAK5183819.1 hypothetical protein LTR44_004101 [Eurotiomycetes sp. CCFEE 6388]